MNERENKRTKKKKMMMIV